MRDLLPNRAAAVNRINTIEAWRDGLDELDFSHTTPYSLFLVDPLYRELAKAPKRTEA